MNEIFERYSVRNFKDKEVPQEDVEMLLKAAMQAPSAVNQQPWEFYVVTDKELLKKLSEVSDHAKPIAKAPLGIVMVNKKETIAKRYQMIDMGICAENIMLEAVSLGLGSVMLGVAPDPERISFVNKLIDLPETLDSFAIIAVGYPESEREVKSRFDSSRIHYIN